MLGERWQGMNGPPHLSNRHKPLKAISMINVSEEAAKAGPNFLGLLPGWGTSPGPSPVN